MLPTVQQREQTTMKKSDMHDDLQLQGKESRGEESSNSIDKAVPKPDEQGNSSFAVQAGECESPISKVESDEMQKVLLEAVVAHSKKEAELRALIAACEENARLKQIELEVIAGEKAEAEKLLAAAEQEGGQMSAQLAYLVPASANGMSGTSTMASSATQLSDAVVTLDVLSCYLPTEETAVMGESLTKVVYHNPMIESLMSDCAELRALCSRLQGEKAALRAAYERKLAAAEEKMTIVATLASSHLTGRMGLEVRLQACDKERAMLATDNTLVKAQDEMMAIGKHMELKSLNSEIERLRRMVRDARASQRIAEGEVARLAALELDSCSEGMSCVSSVYAESLASAMVGDGDEISDCSTK